MAQAGGVRRDEPNLLIRQDALKRSLGAGLRNARRRVGVDPLARHREVQHRADQRERPVRHDRGAAIGDRLDEFPHVAPRDVLHLPRPPRREEVRLEDTLILPPASFMALRVPREVVLREIAERLAQASRLLHRGGVRARRRDSDRGGPGAGEFAILGILMAHGHGGTRVGSGQRKPYTRQLIPTPKQARFIAEYLIDLNATQAAIRAGYSRKTAKQAGYENLTKPYIAAAVAEGQRRQLEQAELSAARVLEEMRRCAFVDARTFWAGTGKTRRVKPPEEWTPEQGAQVAAFEVLIKNAAAGDGKTDLVHKFRLWDKIRALEMLGKHFKLLTDLVQVTNDEERLKWLDEGRTRNAEAK